MATFIHESKLEHEEFRLYVDFLSRLKPGQTVETCIATIEVHSGTDEDVLDMLDGDAAISGTEVYQRIIGGVPGTIYLVSLAARTSINDIAIQQCLLAVLPSPELVPDTLPE